MKQPELGQKVAELREIKGFTQDALAELCEVTPRTIQRVESGEVDPRSYTLTNLRKHLDFDFLEDDLSQAMPWLVALHLSSIFSTVIIPLLIWSFKKRLGNPIDRHGRDAINFQVTTTILLFGAALFLIFMIPGSIIVMEKAGIGSEALYGLLPLAGFLPLIALGIHCNIQGLANAIRVINGKPHRYWLSIPFLK